MLREYATSAPAIISATTSLTIAPSGREVSAEGSGLTYQWHCGTSGDTSNPIVWDTSSGNYTTGNLAAGASYWVRVTGGGTAVDSSRHRLDICSHPDYDQTFDGIMDCRRASFNLSPEDLEEMAQYFIGRKEALAGKAAILALAPMETVLSLIYARHLASKNFMRIFSIWEAACAFVEVEGLPDPFSEVTEDLERRFRYLSKAR